MHLNHIKRHFKTESFIKYVNIIFINHFLRSNYVSEMLNDILYLSETFVFASFCIWNDIYMYNASDH